MVENKEIVNKYLNGSPLQKIADEAECSRVTIKKILLKENITLRKRTKRDYGFNDINALIYYRKGNSVKDTAEKYGVNVGVIRRFLKKNGEKLKSFGHQKRIVKTNPFESHHADVMYWAGMIAADGTIEKVGNKTQPRIALFSKDIEILEQFKSFLNYPVNINTQTNSTYGSDLYLIKFSQPDAIRSLENLGIVSNKSLTFKPKFLLNWQFIRGIFDGDGCFYVNSNNNQPRFDITTGSEKFADELLHFFSTHLLSPYLLKQDNCYRVCIGKKECIKKLYNLLYNNANYYLERKRKKFEDYLMVMETGDTLTLQNEGEDIV